MTALIQKPRKDELTSKGFTNRIKVSNKQTKDSLVKYGFTNYNEPTLYFMKLIDQDISFNLSICKDSLSIICIDILDENSLQPYDYQKQILNGDQNGKPIDIFNKVNILFERLQKDGVITGFNEGMYI